MIVGTLENCEKYYVLGENIKKSLEFLKAHDIREMPDGRYLLDGTLASDKENIDNVGGVLDLTKDNDKDVYVLIQRYTTKNMEATWFESHRKFLDIHYVAEGREYFCYTPIQRAIETRGYGVEEDDLMYNRDFETSVLLKAGDFVLVYPEDVHMPQRRVVPNETDNVVKACIKIRIAE